MAQPKFDTHLFRGLCDCGWATAWFSYRRDAEALVQQHKAGLGHSWIETTGAPCTFTRLVDTKDNWY